MRRAGLICAILAALSPTYAEAAEQIWRVGVLEPAGESRVRSVILPYLATRGFVEGRNLVVDVRTGTEVQLPELAQVLVATNPMQSWPNPIGRFFRCRAATNMIPIVAAPIGRDPVLAGRRELGAPGRQRHGRFPDRFGTRTQTSVPAARSPPYVHRIAVLSNHRKVVEAGLVPLRKAAAGVGLELIEIWVESPNEYAAAFDRMRRAARKHS